MDNIIVDSQNRVPLKIKYVSFVSAKLSTASDTTKTVKTTDVYRFNWEQGTGRVKEFKFPKGWYPIGITYYGCHGGDRTENDKRIAIIAMASPFYSGSEITRTRESNNYMNYVRPKGATQSDYYYEIEFACIPVEYVETHLSEYNLWADE